LKAFVVTLSLAIILTTGTAGYHGHLMVLPEQVDRPLWTDSVGSHPDDDAPRIFAVIGSVQKFMDDKNIGVNLLGGRYELYYKRIM
jgi:hypothetical protein